MRKLLIWLPLRPGTSWLGEGIAQTIENVVQNLSAHIEVTILTTQECATDFSDKLKSRCTILTLPLIRAKRFELKHSDNIAPSIKDFLRERFGFKLFSKFRTVFNFVTYVIALRWLRYQINHNKKFADMDYVWFPAPTIYDIENLNVKKAVSFWDPFVFEYRHFAGIAPVLLRKFAAIYKKSGKIITQSAANKDYLVKVMHIDDSRIHVINNGSPDYSNYKKSVNSLSKDEILRSWPKDKYFGSSRKNAIVSYCRDYINQSILWRLLQKRDNLSCKVILVSTQERPYKGIMKFLEILNTYINRYHENVQLIITAELTQEYSRSFPVLLERVHEITRVNERQHALLHSIADLTIHPSFAEGGLGAYPQFEAESLGKPSLINIGRHVVEMAAAFHLTEREADTISADFANTEEVCEKMHNLLTDPLCAADNVACVQKCRVLWSDASQLYSNIFSG
jgi:glycosyltransferase involved in cell wall biosynthesis